MLHETRLKVETLNVNGTEEVLPAYPFLLIYNSCLEVICLSMLLAAQGVNKSLIILLADQSGAILVWNDPNRRCLCQWLYQLNQAGRSRESPWAYHGVSKSPAGRRKSGVLVAWWDFSRRLSSIFSILVVIELNDFNFLLETTKCVADRLNCLIGEHGGVDLDDSAHSFQFAVFDFWENSWRNFRWSRLLCGALEKVTVFIGCCYTFFIIDHNVGFKSCWYSSLKELGQDWTLIFFTETSVKPCYFLMELCRLGGVPWSEEPVTRRITFWNQFFAPNVLVIYRVYAGIVSHINL